MAYQRQFSNALPVAITQIDGAHSRVLSQKWNSSAQLSFSMDGHDPACALLLELATDILAFRWNEASINYSQADVPVFRGLIDHSEDQVSEQAHTVNFVVHDYLSLYMRRIITQPTTNYVQTDQDALVQYLMGLADYNAVSTSGTSFAPGSWMPVRMAQVQPNGASRAYSGVLRDRSWTQNSVIGTQIDDLAKCVNGFDYDMLPGGPSAQYDQLRVFYPQQGTDRSAQTALVYGINVSAVTRTVASTDYANYVRVVGNKQSTVATAPQLYAEQWNADANNVTVNPVGLWQLPENASDVSVQNTLNDKASGDLALYGTVLPTYTLTLRPGWFSWGALRMGDTVPLYIQSGRLNVSGTPVRIIGIDFTIGDDGQEDVKLTVGMPPASLGTLFAIHDHDIDALARR